MGALISVITSADLERSSTLQSALLALNNEHARELSWADGERFRHLVAVAFFAERVGFADAFLIAFDQDANYDSPNFLWFRRRYTRFVYVDRVVTAPQARGRGLARLLYGRLIVRAVGAGHERIVCEVNSDPPNPGSEALHRSLGFLAVGDAQLPTGKTVTYLERQIRRADREEKQP
jgi:predicted GNAT superfamily acetyltransferase